ncbi:DUF2306 domain-containing protein [Alkalibacillus haloalkaliphilus]|uniref:DUF4190 domain-containing protein n=1 Tax=Alkalibacillus haloalkaliphilus TaxID=94136 RepID=A0A511W864_9BACI|nr:hypothetical protein [Alkalibacillus haloalkaliphilus]MDV2581001.1 hypothetical protein [Alkalibacillus haloalkaliphilus]GEN46528.1 hypothetical protein AHA02nite_23040 [Alkalibacillus haloalkaliphilus]
MSNDDRHPRSYSEDDNYFEQNNNFNPTNDPITGIRNAEDGISNRSDDVEFSSDAATFNPDELDEDKMRKEEKESRYEEHVDAGWGWIALAVSLLSFFVWTLLFAVIGVVMGIYAKRRGANTLGNIAIGIAIAAVAIRLFLFPII